MTTPSQSSNRASKSFADSEKKMSSNQKFTADQIKEMVGTPRLMQGESEKAYWMWWEAFAEERKPECLSDWLDVNQLAIKNWEQERLNRCNTALLDSALRTALRHLLIRFVSPLSGGLITVPETVARDYYGDDEEAREEAREEVAACGITDDHILAEAIQMRGKELLLFDRMDNHRANAKRALQKELDRRSESRRNDPPQKPDKIQDWGTTLDINLEGLAQN